MSVRLSVSQDVLWQDSRRGEWYRRGLPCLSPAFACWGVPPQLLIFLRLNMTDNLLGCKTHKCLVTIQASFMKVQNSNYPFCLSSTMKKTDVSWLQAASHSGSGVRWLSSDLSLTASTLPFKIQASWGEGRGGGCSAFPTGRIKWPEQPLVPSKPLSPSSRSQLLQYKSPPTAYCVGMTGHPEV